MAQKKHPEKNHKETLRGELFHEVEKLGNKEYEHIGFRDEKKEFGDMLLNMVPEVGMTQKAKITIELIGEIKNKKYKQK